MTEHFKFGGGYDGSNLHPAILMAMLLAIALILLLPRRHVIVPFLLLIFLAPAGQEIYVAGVHLFLVRILILTGWIRIAWTITSRKIALVPGGGKFIDKAFLLWAAFRAIAFILLYRDKGAFIYEAGFLWDAIGGFFLLRFLIRERTDISRTVKVFSIIALVLAVTMSYEKLHGLNAFGFVGGHLIPQIRDGAIRAQGPFVHPILAGSFGATLLPLFFWLWKEGTSKFNAVTGIVASCIIVLACASSTPLMALIAGIIALCFWPVRRQMRRFRWAVLILLVSLHLAMKAPVWMLIARVDLVAGNSGYHRAELIDQSVKHFGDWWLVGTNDNVNWGYDMWDLGNQFVAEALTGGLATLVCFIAMISWSFGRIGDARKWARGKAKQEWLIWPLGAALFAHVVAYFGISYFDQTQFAWFALLAVIPVAVDSVKKSMQVPVASAVSSYSQTSPSGLPVNSEFTTRSLMWY
jgi:hypothetical protein